jgi:WD40 repeat protein
VVPTYNDVPLPTDFTDHEGRISGLALLRNNLLASASFDKTLRIWDLTTMKPVAVSGKLQARYAGSGGGAWHEAVRGPTT